MTNRPKLTEATTRYTKHHVGRVFSFIYYYVAIATIPIVRADFYGNGCARLSRSYSLPRDDQMARYSW